MKRALLFIVSIVVAACSQKPLWPTRTPEAKQYTPTPVNVPQIVPGKEVPREWWTLFKSPALDGLVRRAPHARRQRGDDGDPRSSCARKNRRDRGNDRDPGATARHCRETGAGRRRRACRRGDATARGHGDPRDITRAHP